MFTGETGETGEPSLCCSQSLSGRSVLSPLQTFVGSQEILYLQRRQILTLEFER